MSKQQVLKRLVGILTIPSVILVWPVGALAEPPQGIQGNVTVVNTPLPVTGDLEIGNDESNPVPVTVQQGPGFTAVTSGFDVELGVTCFSQFPLYTVQSDKLLIIEDASASVSPTDQNNPINPNIPIQISLETTISGNTFAKAIIGGGLGLPNSFGRTMRTYADPGTDVFLGVSGCTEKVNVSVSFSGRLVDIPN